MHFLMIFHHLRSPTPPISDTDPLQIGKGINSLWPQLGTWGGPLGVWPGPTDEQIEDVLSQVVTIVKLIDDARVHPEATDNDAIQLMLDLMQGNNRLM